VPKKKRTQALLIPAELLFNEKNILKSTWVTRISHVHSVTMAEAAADEMEDVCWENQRYFPM
jgi:hypothetical protein